MHIAVIADCGKVTTTEMGWSPVAQYP
jgi:hypothetical protein